MKKFIVFACLLLALSSPLGAQKIKWLEGSWLGDGYQPNAASFPYWDIQLYYSSKEKTISIIYPSLNCGGKWTLLKNEKNKATFRENLDYGFDKCGNGGTLVVSYIDTKYIMIAYYDPFDHTTIIATGLLKKKQGNI